MHQALYRKYRPRSFDDVCGEEHITSVLQYESKMGKVSHAYLFCGPRGTGKTYCAKILAKAVRDLLRRPEQRKAPANIVAPEAFRWERGTPMITPAHHGKAVRPPVMVICTVCWLLRVLGTVAFEFTADAGRTASKRRCDFISA